MHDLSDNIHRFIRNQFLTRKQIVRISVALHGIERNLRKPGILADVVDILLPAFTLTVVPDVFGGNLNEDIVSAVLVVIGFHESPCFSFCRFQIGVCLLAGNT